jgi:hypothetical protein
MFDVNFINAASRDTACAKTGFSKNGMPQEWIDASKEVLRVKSEYPQLTNGAID